MPQAARDGKYVKGARRPDGTSLILLSAATPGGVTLAQREIPGKTNEIPEIGPMLRELNQRYPLAGHVLTADALHTTADFAGLVTGELAAGVVLTVKDNQPALRALENALWAGAACHVTRDRGHGRSETRSHLVMKAPAGVKAQFPPAEQAARRQIPRPSAPIGPGTRHRSGASTSGPAASLTPHPQTKPTESEPRPAV